MIVAAIRRVPNRIRLLAVLGLPLLVIAGGELNRLRTATTPPAEAGALQARLQHAITRHTERIAAIALDALERGPAAAYEAGRSGPLGERLEGVGLLPRGRGALSQWAGTPVLPQERLLRGSRPSWFVRVDGVRTRLIALSPPDTTGRVALATSVIDSTLDDLAFERTVSRSGRDEFELVVEFLDTAAYGTEQLSGEPDLGRFDQLHQGRSIGYLRSPDGLALAAAVVTPPDPLRLARRARGDAHALAVIVLIVLALLVVPWGRLLHGPGGLLLTLLSIGAARWLLLLTEAPARWLSRELGGAGAYGTPAWGGLLGSPIDLALSGLALLGACLVVRRHALARDTGSRRRVPPSGLGALAGGLVATAACTSLIASIARDAQAPLLDRAAALEGNLVAPLLWLGLGLGVVGAGELWGGVIALARRISIERHPTFDRLVSGGCIALLAIGAALLLQRGARQVDVERLVAEYAPRVLQQEAHRLVVLKSAIGRIHDRLEGVVPDRFPRSSSQTFPAYYLWADSALFRAGYRSAVSLTQLEGGRLSHFGFDVAWRGTVGEPDELEPGSPLLVERDYDITPALTQTVLHAELPVRRAGRLVGQVVVQVLSDPDDLPFLADSRVYLRALGPGPPIDAWSERVEYVRYGPDGTVELTTIDRPPAFAAAFAGAGVSGRVTLSAADRTFVGTAFVDDSERGHLLLVPVAGGVERAAVALRLALIALAIWALVSFAPRLLTRAGIRSVRRGLRRSFYRKLLGAVLLAAVPPLIALALLLQGSIQRQADATLALSATRLVTVAQRVVEDYAASSGEELPRIAINDDVLYWLRRAVGQEIHVYHRDGELLASSKRGLFASGLLPPRLDGGVRTRLRSERWPTIVERMRIGPSVVPVAYAPVRIPGSPTGSIVVAVPLVLEERTIAQAVARVGDTILLATAALVGLLAFTAALLARTVARPVRELVAATDRIAGGDYATRIQPRTEDELAELVQGFNGMASSLARQRADLEQRRDYMEALLRHATTAVISLDTSGRVVTANPAASALLESLAGGSLAPGVGFVELVGNNESLAPIADALEAANRGEPFEIDLADAAGARRLQLVRVDLRNAAGERFGELVLLDDVTDLMRSNQLAAWAEMARVIAHEIKNPLTPIQLSSEHLRRLLDDRGVLPAPDVEACLETIIKQVRALHEIAGEFSTYAKLPVLNPQPIDPVEFMRGTLAPYRASNPSSVEIVERYEAAPAVAIDRRVLARAVINLVQNALQAIEATGRAGRITLAVAHDPSSDEVRLSVADDGPGLAPDVRRRLFEPYFSTKSGGTGLGLAIARRAVEAHGGRIEVDVHEVSGGTRFTIRLPVAGDR